MPEEKKASKGTRTLLAPTYTWLIGMVNAGYETNPGSYVGLFV